MSLVWIYVPPGTEYKREQELDPNQVLMIINNGCESIKSLLDYIVNNVLHQTRYVRAGARAYKGGGDALVHFVINVDGGNREVMVIVSRNPADTLFNYYTSSSTENIIECDFG